MELARFYVVFRQSLDWQLVDLASQKPIPLTKELLLDPKSAFLFADAKKSLQELAQIGLDVARPVCLATLAKLTNQNPPKPESIEQWRHSLDDLLTNVSKAGQEKVARLECLILRAIARLEVRGLPINMGSFEQFVQKTENELGEAKTNLRQAIGESPVDLFGHMEADFDSAKAMKLAIEKLTGHTLADTSQHSLAQIDHPAAKALLAYREKAKLYKTYGPNFTSHINSQSNRIHATFEPLGTSTGRIACHSPNLQNLPLDEGFRKCIAPLAGRILVSADYSACELRILAAFANDPIFLDAFERDVDVHSETAKAMFGKEVSKQQNPDLRQKAKAINFGLIYGMGAGSLARSLRVGIDEAERLFDRYFVTYPKIRDYLEGAVFQGQKKGYCETVLGRRLYFDDAKLDASAQGRLAKNMPIQGTGADIIKLAMLKVHERLLRDVKTAFLVNTVHDELLVECDQVDAEVVANALQEEMQEAQAALLPRVKPKVETTICPFWTH